MKQGQGEKVPADTHTEADTTKNTLRRAKIASVARCMLPHLGVLKRRRLETGVSAAREQKQVGWSVVAGRTRCVALASGGASAAPLRLLASWRALPSPRA